MIKPCIRNASWNTINKIDHIADSHDRFNLLFNNAKVVIYWNRAFTSLRNLDLEIERAIKQRVKTSET